MLTKNAVKYRVFQIALRGGGELELEILQGGRAGGFALGFFFF